MTIAQIMEKMIAFSEGNIHDIDHLIRVWTYARTIGELEGLDRETQCILEVAAITHDIACPLCREKYGNTNGKYQEAEGVPMATTFITNHVRQIGVQTVTALRRHDRTSSRRALRHLLMIFSFVLGVLVLTPLCGLLQEKAIWAAALPLLVCFVVLVHADLGTEHELFDRKPHGH